MRRLLYALCVALAACAPVAAQETPRAEVFGGYSYAGEGTHGWGAAVNVNINRWLGLVADAGGQYASLDGAGSRERIRTHSILFGPQFSARRRPRLTPFARVLLGASHVNSDATEAGQRFVFTDTSFAAAVGGGLDVKINDRLALRAFQAEYLRTHFFGETQNKGRLSFGLVLRLGRKG